MPFPLRSLSLAFAASSLMSFSAVANTLPQYLKLQSAKTGELAVLSYQGTGSIHPNWPQHELAPRGSAALTSSGALGAAGIRYIIHSAPGAMDQNLEGAEPELTAVELSIRNAVRIANTEGIRRLAIPLVGGGIFLNSLQSKNSSLTGAQLAQTIIQAAAKEANSKLEVVFIAYTKEDLEAMNSGFETAKTSQAKEKSFFLIEWIKRLIAYFSRTIPTNNNFFQRVGVIQGSITDFNVHHADAIVNAANMELQFGGGLSGVIGRATKDQEHIDQVGKTLIRELYKREPTKK